MQLKSAYFSMAQEDHKKYLRSLLDTAISSEHCETVNFRALRKLLEESIERCCNGTSNKSEDNSTKIDHDVKQLPEAAIHGTKFDITSDRVTDYHEEDNLNINLLLKNVDDHLALTVELPEGGICVDNDELHPTKAAEKMKMGRKLSSAESKAQHGAKKPLKSSDSEKDVDKKDGSKGECEMNFKQMRIQF